MLLGCKTVEDYIPNNGYLGALIGRIGNRINQLAAKANALDFVDAPMLREEAKRWQEFRLDVSRSYLLPRKQTG